MPRRALMLTVLIGSALWSGAQDQIATSSLFPLLQSLSKASASGSIELSGACDADHTYFPPISIPSRKAATPLETAREMFADDAAMQIRQDRDGMLRMVEEGVQTDLLDVRITHVKFERNGIPLQNAAFSPGGALWNVIMEAPEVLGFAKAHNFVFPPMGGAAFGNLPHTLESTHLKGQMDHVTVRQALDRLLKTFPGLWVYESCSAGNHSRFVYIWFFSARNPGVF